MTFGVKAISDNVYLNSGESVHLALNPGGSITIAPAFEVQSFSLKYLGD
jgi:hypothetical protein